MSGASRQCERCGAEVPGGPDDSGTCLACLLSLGVAEDPPGDRSSEGSSGDPREGGETIGPYRIDRLLGEGGMGQVYLATQREPIRRTVALKVIKLGMDSTRIVERFKAERQALALMDHPAIASVHDAGTTSAGRPYFAMEYVDGEPITLFCDRRRLTIDDRLRLFAKVCEGVQHAHQKGVIHRDLKPSNVLVTDLDGVPAPKIIDFGVAKAIEQRLTERTVMTELGVLLGTPEYMSPEQAEVSPLDVDTRTDVYSLGTMLYELLTGTLPLEPGELRASSFDEVRRRIREEDPPTPSRRVASFGDASGPAQSRRTEAKTLLRRLSGDLDWITSKALEKDPDRRYGSPAELADDVTRHLANDPVLARPPTAAYRIGRFVRRNRLLVGSSVVVLLAVGAGAVVATTFGIRAVRARDDLSQVAAFQSRMLSELDAEGMGRRLIEDLRRRGDGDGDGDGGAAVESFDDFVSGVNPTNVALSAIDDEVLSRASTALDREFADQPLIETQLRVTLGNTYLALGMAEPAERELRKAVSLRSAELGRGDALVLDAEYALAEAIEEAGRVDESLELHERVLDARRRLSGESDPATLRSKVAIASIYKGSGRLDDAALMFETVLDEQSRTIGRDDRSTLSTMIGLADLYSMQRRFEQAEQLHLEIVDRHEKLLGSDHPATLGASHNLARMYAFEGRLDEAEEIYTRVLAARRRVLGDDHRQTLESLNSLSLVHFGRGRYELAEPASEQLIASRRRVLGTEHPDTLDAMNNLANVFLMTERLDRAADLHRDVLAIRTRIYGESHPRTASSKYNLATVLLNGGQLGEAGILLRQVVMAREESFGDSHPETMHAVLQLAFVAALSGDRPEAIELIGDAVERGWTDVSLFDSPGLESLRGLDEFEELRASVVRRTRRD